MIPAGDTGITWPSLKKNTRSHGTGTALRTAAGLPYAHGAYADSVRETSSLRTTCGLR